jgi:hypothetical protein
MRTKKIGRRIAAPSNAPLDDAGTRIPVPSPCSPASFLNQELAGPPNRPPLYACAPTRGSY